MIIQIFFLFPQFRFPIKDARQREQWNDIITGWNLQPVTIKKPLVCDVHFSPDSLLMQFGRSTLKDGVVPIIHVPATAANIVLSWNEDDIIKDSSSTMKMHEVEKNEPPLKNLTVSDIMDSSGDEEELETVQSPVIVYVLEYNKLYATL